MESIERGVIRNRNFATQIRDFSGLRFGTITPTDMDGYEDWHNKAWVFIELKYGEANLPYGQKLAFQRLCADMAKIKPTIGLVARHWAQVPADIKVADAVVTEAYYQGEWKTLRTWADCTVRNVMETFHAMVDGRPYTIRRIHTTLDIWEAS